MIHERTDIVEYTIDDMEAYAKEQVLKELEEVLKFLHGHCKWILVVNEITLRIKELKQK